MSASIEDILKALAPELEDLPEAQLLVYIELAENQIPASMCQRPYAVALLAAHIATLAQLGNGPGGSIGASGPATTLKEGQLSVTFSSGSAFGVQGALGSTRFGIELDRLYKSCIITPRTVLV